MPCRAQSVVASPPEKIIRRWMRELTGARAPPTRRRSGDGATPHGCGSVVLTADESAAPRPMAPAAHDLAARRRGGADGNVGADRSEVLGNPSPASGPDSAAGEANAWGAAGGKHARKLTNAGDGLRREVAWSLHHSAHNCGRALLGQRDRAVVGIIAGWCNSPLFSKSRGSFYSTASFLDARTQNTFRCSPAVEVCCSNASPVNKNAACSDVARLNADAKEFAEAFDFDSDQALDRNRLDDDGSSSAQCLRAVVAGAIPELRAIHPTASVHPDSWLGEGVEVGAFCTVGPQVKLGNGCKLQAGCQILGDSRLGENCVLLTGAVVGADIPGRTIIGDNNTIGYYAKVGVKCQDKKYKEGDESYLYVGNNNDIREFTSIHRSSESNDSTVIGSGNLIMGCCNVAHNCKIGSRNILANGTLLGGHVVIENLVHVGGAVSVHQGCHLGSYSFLAGGSMVYHDVPMFMMVAGDQAELRCLNLEGMRRYGFSNLEVRSIRKAYQKLFMNSDPNAGGLKERLSQLGLNEELSNVPAVKQMLRSVEDCFGEKRRGLCSYRDWNSGVRASRKSENRTGDEAVRCNSGVGDGEVAERRTAAPDEWIGSATIWERGSWFTQLLDSFAIGVVTQLKEIHATALVHPSARIGKGVEIGAFCTVGPLVKLGNGCRLQASCHLFGDTQLGDNCVLETGAVVGADIPGCTIIGDDNTIGSCSVVGVECQDMKYKEGEQCFLYVGNNNKIGKFTSIHRSSKPNDKTILGNDNQIMDWCHVSHDCKMGNGNLLANGTLLGGHVVTEDFVHTGGAVAVHQFCHLGSYSFLAEESVVVRDVPMFMMVAGDRAEIRSLSAEGMQSYGCSDLEVEGLSKSYQKLFMNSDPNAGGLGERLFELDVNQELSSVPAVRQMLQSIRDSFGGKRRGISSFRQRTAA